MSSFAEPDGRLLCLFDGHCGLCNGTVRWFLRRDRLNRLCFVAFDSPRAAELLMRNGIGTAEAIRVPNSLIVMRPTGSSAETLLVRSEAALALLGALPYPWPAVAGALRWIPRPMRDLGYRLVARWRYRIAGRQKSCPECNTS